MVLQGVAASIAPSTLRSYRKAWTDFLSFTDPAVSADVRSPPSSDQVLKYLAHLFQAGRASKTLRIQAAAISFFSKTFFNKDPCAKFVVRKALEGWGRLCPPRAPGRRPISFELLTRMRMKLRSICWTKYEARLFSAAFSLAFFGALRVGEVVLEPIQGGGSRGLLLQDVLLSSSEVVLTIRSSKTDQLGRGAVIRLPATKEAGPCPVKDTSKFLAVRSPAGGPFLVHADGTPLARHQFSRVMRKVIMACGHPASEYAPHSFRIGAATAAAHWGLSAARIKDLGRWKSEVYKGYVRK